METYNWPKVIPRQCGLELRLLGYLTLPSTLLSDGVMAPALGYTQHLESRALSSRGWVPQAFPCWLWELVGRAVRAPPPAPRSLCLAHSSALSCTPLSLCLPQPAVPRSPSKSLNQEHCCTGSSLPPGFCWSPSLHHVWPLRALDRPLPPMP